MKNILILILAILTTQHLKAQYFTEVTPSPFKDMFDGNSVFADVDGDGDLDLFIVGFASGESVILYKNDGNGNYTEDTGNSFEGVRQADVAVADVNGNGHLDLLISGRNSSGNAITNLYLNDGTGQYTLDNSVNFDGVKYGTVDFADFNGDGSPDVLITGKPVSGAIAELYINDGNGGFTKQTGTPFIGVEYSSVIVLDVNGDTYLDIIISGDPGNPDYSTNVYINDGTGQFTLQSTTLLPVNRGALAYADVDNDGDLDIVIVGRTTSSAKAAKLYLNDGSGVFTEQTSLALTGVEFASAGFSDINCDGNPDLIVSGLVSNRNRSSEIFINDGNGGFVLLTPHDVEPISQGSISFGDVDGDLDKDVLITGLYEKPNGYGGTFTTGITRLYLNECIVLPIELISFTGEYKDLTNILTWVTSSERNNDYFILSYSSNGEHWEIIKKIPGAGNSNSIQNYQVSHNDFENGINYYKLMQVDFDGQAKVYPIISIDNSETNAFLTKRINILGQEVKASYKGLVIEYYSNGKTIKKWNN